MAKPKPIEDMTTSELLRQREALRRRRDQLIQKGIDTKYGTELQVRQIAVWSASRATIDTKNLSLDELTYDLGEADISALSADFLDLLADKAVSDMSGVSVLDLDEVTPDDIGQWTAFVSVEIEAELLRRLVPKFNHTVQEKKLFEAQSSREASSSIVS